MPDDQSPDAEKVEKLTNLLKLKSDALERLNGIVDKNSVAYKNALSIYKDVYSEFEKLKESMTPVGLNLTSLTSGINSLNSAFTGSLAPIAEFGKGIVNNLINSVGRYSEIIAGVASSTYRDFVNPLSNSSTITNKLGEHISGLNDSIKALLNTQSTARTAFTMFETGIEGVNAKASLYPQMLRLASASTGIMRDELDKMNKTMSIVPHALDQVSGGIGGIAATESMTIQQTAILATASKAFGMTAEESANMGNKAYMEFGQLTGETIEKMGILAEAANQTGVAKKVASDQILNASTSLAIFGRGTAGAAEIWTTFVSSLQNSGVPIKHIGDIVNQVTSSVANMSVQNRAFIGMVSGITQGRSALGGALQLELEMRSPEGMQKNLQALTTTLSQFAGGKVITLEEAVRNPQLEMQFQLQRQMLGQLTGITTQEQQNRILETLKNVQSGGISAIDGSKALQDVYKQGQNIQERQLSSVERIEDILRARFGEAADRQLEDLDKSFRDLKLLGQSQYGLDAASRISGRIGTRADKTIGGSVEGNLLISNLARQVVGFPEHFDALLKRRGIGGEGSNLTGAMKALDYRNEPVRLEPRQPRQLSTRPIPVEVKNPIVPSTETKIGEFPEIRANTGLPMPTVSAPLAVPPVTPPVVVPLSVEPVVPPAQPAVTPAQPTVAPPAQPAVTPAQSAPPVAAPSAQPAASPVANIRNSGLEFGPPLPQSPPPLPTPMASVEQIANRNMEQFRLLSLESGGGNLFTQMDNVIDTIKSKMTNLSEGFPNIDKTKSTVTQKSIERTGTTSEIIIKILDEGRTDMSKKVKDEIIAYVNKMIVGINTV